ncbi:MAG: hypothetical protein RIS64_4309, partial [Bacteroidota bacterium]
KLQILCNKFFGSILVFLVLATSTLNLISISKLSISVVALESEQTTVETTTTDINQVEFDDSNTSYRFGSRVNFQFNQNQILLQER